MPAIRIIWVFIAVVSPICITSVDITVELAIDATSATNTAHIFTNAQDAIGVFVRAVLLMRDERNKTLMDSAQHSDRERKPTFILSQSDDEITLPSL